MDYLVSPRAMRDLEAIAGFIAQRNVGAAERVLIAFYEAFTHLREVPVQGTLLTFRGIEMRVRPCTGVIKSYLIYFRVEADEVMILRVIHSARDQRDALDEPDDSAQDPTT